MIPRRYYEFGFFISGIVYYLLMNKNTIHLKKGKDRVNSN